MKFILAPDKFKGSLTGIEFCNAVQEGIQSIMPEAEIVKLPLADGGDGTIDVLNYHLRGERIKVHVKDPLFRSIETSYLYIRSSQTAFIEMAKASGMDLLTPEEQNCFYTTSFGTGELIMDAVNQGATTIILGIGGSATNDCGIGMAGALGYQFLDKNGDGVNLIGKNLALIDNILTTEVHKELSTISFKVACDVTNPLYGKNGAAVVYGPQKGANQQEVKLLDQGLVHFAQILKDQFSIDVQEIKGSGAAGGMGAAALTFLNAQLISGIDLVKNLVDFDQKIKGADWLITGEGKLDTQTLSGKTLHGVISSAIKLQIPIAVFCGSIHLTETELKKLGISYADTLLNKAKNFDDAVDNAYNFLRILASEFSTSLD